VRTRKAVVTDAREVHDLIAQYSGDGTLLPRRYGEICENIRDFVVVEHRGRIVACGALHIYGPHLGEVRSIAVAPEAQGRGAGRRLIDAWLARIWSLGSPGAHLGVSPANTRAMGFYEATGWTRLDVPWGVVFTMTRPG